MTEEEKVEKSDPRIEFFQNYVMKSMSIRNERWKKTIEDFGDHLNGFLKETYQEMIVFYGHPQGHVAISYNFPAKTKNKMCYFIRRKLPTTLTAQNLREVLMYGDLLPNPLENLCVLLENVYYPLLCNPQNQVGWNSSLSQELSQYVQELRNAITDFKGHIIKKTILALPLEINEIMDLAPEFAEGDLSKLTNEIKHSIENMVVKWLSEIKEFIDLSPMEVVYSREQHPKLQNLFAYWEERLENIEYIIKQLADPRIKTIGYTLEAFKSPFVTTFRDMFHLVVSSLAVARDIVVHLKPLKLKLEEFESVDLETGKELLRPLTLVISFVWGNSKYFCTSEHMIILFQLFHNALIDISIKTISPDTIFQDEIDEAAYKIKGVMSTIERYKSIYEDCKGRLKEIKTNSDVTPEDWLWEPKEVFERLDAFFDRLKELYIMISSSIEFLRLEKIEIHGIRGRYISAEISSILEEFNSTYAKFGKITFNPLDPDPNSVEFRNLKDEYMSKIDILERKLGFQFEKAFDDCVEINQSMQLVELLGNLLHKPVIKEQCRNGIFNIVTQFNDEINSVNGLFEEFNKKYHNEGIQGMGPYRRHPPGSGILCWLRKLKCRIEKPHKEFIYLQLPDLFENEFGQETMSHYFEVIRKITELEKQIHSQWQKEIASDIKNGMIKTILHTTDNHFYINFDEELVEAIKDIRTIYIMGYKMKSEIMEFWRKEDEIWNVRKRARRIEEWFNEFYDNTHITELTLIEQEVLEIVESLEPLTLTMKWNDFDFFYIELVFERVKDLHIRVVKAQTNLKNIFDNIATWDKEPLFTRRNNDSKSLLDIFRRDEIMAKRAEKIEEAQSITSRVMTDNCRCFLRETVRMGKKPKDAPEDENIEDLNMKEMMARIPSGDRLNFRQYEKYIDSMIVERILTSIYESVKYIKAEIDDSLGHSIPLFEISMELQEPRIVYIPPVDPSYPRNFLTILEGILDDIFSIATIFPRVNQPFDSKSGLVIPTLRLTNFESELKQNGEINKMREDIITKAAADLINVRNHALQYSDYAFFWTEDKENYISEIKKYGHPLTQMEKLDIENLKEEEPTLSVYKEELEKLYAVREAVNEIENYQDFGGWLRLLKQAFKYGLLNLLNDWINLFKRDLIDRVADSLQELEDFINKAQSIMNMEVDKEDVESFLLVMNTLNEVAEREPFYDGLFDPLKDAVDLLKAYDYKFSDKIYNQFQELPDRWIFTKKLSYLTKQRMGPIHAYQKDLMERRIMLFESLEHFYRKRFVKERLFQVPCDNVYDIIDECNEEILELEKRENYILQFTALFELRSPEDDELILCRQELIWSKMIWDFVLVIESTIEDWTQTKWSKVNIDDIDQECKKIGKELRTLPKEVRKWPMYPYAENMLKNLMTSLRSVTELQNPAMRDRHWKELEEETRVKIDLTPNTTLGDLLRLNLHNFEDEIKNIVEKSVKEQAMEKVLRDIRNTWNKMSFGVEIYDRTGLKLMKVTEEMIELLEDHQVQLQNILSSKFVGYFLEEVTTWLQKLSNADLIQATFIEVQRKWMYLENIFIASQDIRTQLPEDSKRFDYIDRDFKDLVKTINSDRNVIRATSKQGLIERLENLSRLLVLCEKALEDYLDQKRLKYPRFYFISPADLLDILSNGNKPKLVSRHLSKLYDSIKKLEFKNDPKLAIAMRDKEFDEYVQFVGECDCSGQVEVWLNRVTDKMRETLKDILRRAVKAYEDKPRHVWVFEWQAQCALVSIQIWWNEETVEAFSKLDLGYENALKDYHKKQIIGLNSLISLLIGDLSPADRQKINTICTIDVHNRDVVGKLINTKVESSNAFQWQSQLRHRWDHKESDCFANICDAGFKYDYEYLGNKPRLVITPLTDRCYITLTQSLHLVMGGAPAGPAGTGKTETTKDLGRALGMMVYVFNCSEQMDYRSIGNIHKGLAQCGAWGCFDEFNRISVEVLSVVSLQVKTIQDAIKAKKSTFNFLGEIIPLRHTVGLFITMNPGYAGRTELPENLKALYRPCAMVVPDFELICEIMFVAEGFQDARLLARKFMTLYSLCKELLSKQFHYDWGLRAIKSVLVVAGKLKRNDPFRPEDEVLMRALRDFNIPKIVTDDLPVFMGLIGDLFPALDVPRQRDYEFEALVKQSTLEAKLQPEEAFLLKIVQLEELLAVRHSVFILGNAGTGKTRIWKTLIRTYYNQRKKPHYNDLNPKAVTTNELFGVVNPATREWRDGLISIIMRDQANMAVGGPKWIVMDGDIDPMWIESLNTVMDDNKVLTLASNERIPLTSEMRLLFEIYTLRVATPATVSRAGILYVNPQDLQWSAYVASWLHTRENSMERSMLQMLFDKYVPPLLKVLNKSMKTIIAVTDIARLQMTCYLLEAMLTPQNVPPDCPKDWYEIYFVFAVIWGFGSTLFRDQIIDWRKEFNKWWISEFETIKFPSEGTIFDYYVDQETKQFIHWSNLIKPFQLDPFIPLQSNVVHTNESTRTKYFVDILVERGNSVMLVGPAGSGKTVIMLEKLNALSTNYMVTKVPFNFYTTSEMLQNVLEEPLEKKAGRNYGPPGNKAMIFFVDDMNMPEVDTYGTVQPHTLIRQFMDYKHWYDRQKMTLKDIHNCQFVAAMNQLAGSFTINPRLQRHFCTFATNPHSVEGLFHILNSILSEHLAFPQNNFNPKIIIMCDTFVHVAIAVHQKICVTFLPTAVKFHYIFNLRDLTNIFTGLLFTTGKVIADTDGFLRLYVHEANRVYGDKMVNTEDMTTFNRILTDNIRKNVENFNQMKVFAKPVIFCHFANGLQDLLYAPVVGEWEKLKTLLDEAQVAYNEFIGAMNLVLFEDAMAHICRINRIVESPRGNALLIGVGGSGKQSLTRLACFISSLDVFQIQLSKDYTMADLKANIATLFLKAGVKSVPNCFLMTDAEVPKEQFLVVINDLLSSGIIHELFTPDERENIIANIRNEAKEAGIGTNKDDIWEYFIDKVRTLLKVVLCFSPVGSTLRIRCRRFPALINGTTIDWFHEWPQQALESVSHRFLSLEETVPNELAEPASRFIAFVHGTVNQMSRLYLMNEKRYNYATPKSFLELISLYRKLLREKVHQNVTRIERLENGLIKLDSCQREVDGLQEVLRKQEIAVTAKNEKADRLIVVVSAESEKVQKERDFVTEEEKKVRVIEEDVTIKAKLCEEDYKKAEPALIAAQEALNTLNKNNLTELKSFGAPPEAVVNVCAAVLVLFSPKGKIPKDRSWKACKAMMGKVDQFLSDLINYDKEHIQPEVIKALQPYLEDPQFNPEKIASKSLAAAGLCAWVININKFYEVYEVVGPKLQALVNTQKELQDARNKLIALHERLAELESKLADIQSEYNAALAEKQKIQEEVDKTAFTIDLAKRLITGLASEKIRWTDSIQNLKEGLVTLPGDVLLLSCFMSYVGCFTKFYRNELQMKYWQPKFDALEPPIPCSEQTNPFGMICDEAQIAEWNNQGLPTDKMSAENAAILTHCERYPLIIDPQLQGLKWIKQKYGKEMVVTRLSVRNYLDVVENAVKDGKILLIENIEESIDPVLNNILSRMLIRKGTALRLGDKEIDFNPKFKLILHTKLANPHYKPEMQAQTTLINFTVTKDGLEDQLLVDVVKAERPDLEMMHSKLVMQQNIFKITLKHLEDDLLARLSAAGENILEDITLVMNLEKTKKTSEEIAIKVAEAKETTVQLDAAREFYRPAAERGAIIYFIMNDLFRINPIYQFSLKAFKGVFSKGLHRAIASDIVKMRVGNLVESITYISYTYTSRSLFENDKLIFLLQLVLQKELTAGEANPAEVDFLLKYPYNPNVESPFTFLSHSGWGGIKVLCKYPAFVGLDKDFESANKRWKKIIDSETPEREKLPGEWKNKNTIQKLCVLRCLRPDRMSYGVTIYIEEKLGTKYTEPRREPFSQTFLETNNTTHVFFILSPGVDPIKDVEKLGKTLGFSADNENFHNVSLGQGQEVIAENAIDMATKNGQWVILQNVHLVARWLPTLDKKIEAALEGAHEDYRLFLSAEPAVSHETHVIPQGILESAIKITNEPPTGMVANLHKAFDNFTQETLEMCSKETEFKTILFALCYFHAVVAERRKFGAQGWNRVYPFNFGDLTISVYVLYNYLEGNTRVPWEDLRYLFGEIMYGGHITDDWDRRLCRSYLEVFMQPELIDGDLYFCPGFAAPGNTDYESYHKYIDDNLPPESPNLYGLHLNAEIGFLTNVSERLFRIVLELQPRTSGAAGSDEQSEETIIKTAIDDIVDKIPPPFNVYELIAKCEDRNPYITVAFQECDRMNILLGEVKRSMVELDLGLKGELTISSNMEQLMNDILLDKVPISWEKLAYPSTYGMMTWFADLLNRLSRLESWVKDYTLPATVWLGGLFNPQSFLTAIMQQTARKNEWPLDRMCLNCDVTKKIAADFSAPPKEGAFLSGLFMEGARWDSKLGAITDAYLKELYPEMPVIFVKAVTQDKQDIKNVYECPVYKIRTRGPTYVWTFNLKTKDKSVKWVLAGVALILQV